MTERSDKDERDGCRYQTIVDLNLGRVSLHEAKIERGDPIYLDDCGIAIPMFLLASEWAYHRYGDELGRGRKRHRKRARRRCLLRFKGVHVTRAVMDAVNETMIAIGAKH